MQAALDKTDDDRTAMSSLLAYLNANEVVSAAQTKKGFDRLYEVRHEVLVDEVRWLMAGQTAMTHAKPVAFSRRQHTRRGP